MNLGVACQAELGPPQPSARTGQPFVWLWRKPSSTNSFAWALPLKVVALMRPRRLWHRRRLQRPLANRVASG